VSADPALDNLMVTPRFEFGPDVFDPMAGRWWDVTTIGDWAKHVGDYSDGFGRGIPLIYR
jgi:hypothetical protein